jgi:hypothetical protein
MLRLSNHRSLVKIDLKSQKLNLKKLDFTYNFQPQFGFCKTKLSYKENLSRNKVSSVENKLFQSDTNIIFPRC